MCKNAALFVFLFWVIVSSSNISDAQVSPSSMDELSYSGLFAAASQGDADQIRDFVKKMPENLVRVAE